MRCLNVKNMGISWKVINYLATFRQHLTKIIRTGFTLLLVDKKEKTILSLKFFLFPYFKYFKKYLSFKRLFIEHWTLIKLEHGLFWNIISHAIFNPDWYKGMSQEISPKWRIKTLVSKVIHEFSFSMVQWQNFCIGSCMFKTWWCRWFHTKVSEPAKSQYWKLNQASTETQRNSDQFSLQTRIFSSSKWQGMKASVHFVWSASGTLRLTLAGSQAPAQPGTLSHPLVYRGETGFYDLLFSVILNKAKPLAGALVELDVEVVQALSRALWKFISSSIS